MQTGTGMSRNNTVKLYCMKEAIKEKLSIVNAFSVTIEREVVLLYYTTWEHTVFTFQPEPPPICIVCKSTWLILWYLDPGFRITFIRKDS